MYLYGRGAWYIMAATVAIAHKETVYIAREDGCACRYIKNREGFPTRTEDFVRLMVDVMSL